MRITRTLGIMLLACSSAGIAFAQAGGGGGPGGGGFGGNGGQGGGPGGGFGGGPGNFDPAQMQQQMMDNIKQQLDVSDQDFAAIQPALQAVMQAQRDAGNAGRGGRGGRGGGGGGGPGGQQTQATTPVQKALADLQVILDNSSSTPEQIHAKVQIVRDAKTAAHDKLTKAQEELRTLLTQRQEATLTVMGYLE